MQITFTRRDLRIENLSNLSCITDYEGSESSASPEVSLMTYIDRLRMALFGGVASRERVTRLSVNFTPVYLVQTKEEKIHGPNMCKS